MGKFFDFAVGVVLVASLASGPALADVKLNYSEGGPNRGDFAHNLNWFVDQVAGRSSGDVDINVNWSGALLASKDVLGGLQDGVVDMGTLISQYTPAETAPILFPELAIIRDPDPWVGARAIADTFADVPELGDWIADELGLVVLSNFYINPSYIVCSGDAVTDIDTLNGKKLRGSGSIGKALGAAGANIANLSLYESYQALSTGLVDCTQSYATTTRTLKLYEVADNMTYTGAGQAGAFYLTISKDVFDGLSSEQKDLLVQVGQELNDYAGLQTVQANADAIASMEKGIDGDSLKVFNMDDAAREELLKNGATLAEEWVARVDKMGLPGQKILDTYLANYAKYEGIRDSQGYPKQ